MFGQPNSFLIERARPYVWPLFRLRTETVTIARLVTASTTLFPDGKSWIHCAKTCLRKAEVVHDSQVSRGSLLTF